MRKSRLSRHKQDRLVEHFVAGTTTRCAASLAGVNFKTSAYYFHKLREIIAYNPWARDRHGFQRWDRSCWKLFWRQAQRKACSRRCWESPSIWPFEARWKGLHEGSSWCFINDVILHHWAQSSAGQHCVFWLLARVERTGYIWLQAPPYQPFWTVFRQNKSHQRSWEFLEPGQASYAQV